mmetsp:Transcript_3593/g.11900  ORF Transcript_3593/g.11900 Transcript_3593/m.11900 type:complete len:235 (+) Transcript_3593:761-1465(+)
MVASKRRPASSTAAASGGGSSKSSLRGGAAGGAGVSVGSAVEASNISLARRRTETPSPHECSKLMAAFAFSVTTSWKDLSNQRSIPRPCSIARFTSPSSSGDDPSKQTAKSASSICLSEAPLAGAAAHSCSRSAAHSPRGREVRCPTPADPPLASAGEARIASKAPCSCEGGTGSPAGVRRSTAQKAPPRCTTTCRESLHVESSSSSGRGSLVERNRFAYCDMSSAYAPVAAAP